MTDPTALPPDLPEPVDDGACDHLPGIDLPDVELRAHDGTTRSLRAPSSRWLVLYVYPRTGGPGVVLPDDWDLIPGARGCTPQSCAFRDHHAELRALDATVWGLSAQPLDEQREFAERMRIPFPLLNDSGLRLAEPPLRLPVFQSRRLPGPFGAERSSVTKFTADGLTLYRRVTLVADRGRISRVFYPVFPPQQNARDVLDHLTRAA